MARCEVCFRHCELSEGQTGFCGGRICKGGKVCAKNYGAISSLALDPIEKKPLNRFYPGSMILSVGSYGCDLRCPFCQNNEISWSREALQACEHSRKITPQELVRIAQEYKERGNIGIAFTYNEPLIGYEFVRDTASLSHKAAMKNVLVTNGTAELSVLEELSEYIDAMNIDLKCFDESVYRSTLGGDLEMVKSFIAAAVKICHVELTTLIVPGISGSEDQMKEMCEWICSLTDAQGRHIGHNIPLHLTRFFPRFKMSDGSPTDISLIHRLENIAKQKLQYVYLGNCGF